MLLMLILLTFLIIPCETYASEMESTNIERYNLDVLERDVLTVYIYPTVEGVLVGCKSLDSGNPFEILILTNYTIITQSRQVIQKTVIQIFPESRGTCNLTITFQSDSVWEYTIGVYIQSTRNVDFYGKNVKFSGNFGEFFTFARHPGNWTISIILNSFKQSSSSFFQIELPTPVNAALFMTAAGFIAYFNIFLIFDTYFKNKKETISSKRWLLCGIVIIISAVTIYELYTLSTFPFSWSV